MTRPRAAIFPLKHIRELDGIRGLAAIMVFFHHSLNANLADRNWTGALGVASRLAAYGNTGVDLFFVLSGFLITSLLIQDRASTRYYKDFYWKRALRILPLYLICLLFVVLVQRRFASFVLVALFIANFDSVFHVLTYGPLWTLAIEEHFYLIWPTIVRRSSLKRILQWGLLLGIAPILLRFLFARFHHYNYHLTFLHCDGLAFGAVLAYRHRTTERTPENRRRERNMLLLLLTTAIGVLCLSAVLASHGERSVAWSAALEQTGTTLFMGSAVGLVITYAGHPVVAVLRSRLFVFLGLISYALYLVHDALLFAYDRLFGQPRFPNAGSVVLRCVVVLAASLALSVLSRYVIELPAMSLRRRVLAHPNPRSEFEDPPLPLARM